MAYKKKLTLGRKLIRKKKLTARKKKFLFLMIRIAQFDWFAFLTTSFNLNSFPSVFSKNGDSSSSFMISGDFFVLLLDKLSSYNEDNHLQFFQKQRSRGVLRKRCSENMQQIYKRTPVPKCNFSSFPEIALRHGCSSVNLLLIFRTPFPKNTPGLLLLSFDLCVIPNLERSP